MALIYVSHAQSPSLNWILHIKHLISILAEFVQNLTCVFISTAKETTAQTAKMISVVSWHASQRNRCTSTTNEGVDYSQAETSRRCDMSEANQQMIQQTDLRY